MVGGRGWNLKGPSPPSETAYWLEGKGGGARVRRRSQWDLKAKAGCGREQNPGPDFFFKDRIILCIGPKGGSGLGSGQRSDPGFDFQLSGGAGDPGGWCCWQCEPTWLRSARRLRHGPAAKCEDWQRRESQERVKENRETQSKERVAPLHSTALYSEAEEIFRPRESLIPSVVSTPPRKKARTSMEVIENQSEEEGSLIGRRTKKALRKSRPLLDDDTESESISDRVTHLVKGMRKQKTTASSPICSTNLPEKCAESVFSNELFVAEKSSLVTKNEAKTLRRGISLEKEKSQSQPLNPDSQYISSLEKKKKSTRDKAKSHIVLSAFEDTLVQYKQQVESIICQRAIDSFYSVFKEQFIKILSEVQKLKNLKRKNAKVITNINKKRKCLFEAQDQLIRTEPQLKYLQIKHEELKERKSSFTEATWFFSNLKQLHDDYAALNRQAPSGREEYDSSSLPALLFEARSISGAAQHLKKINSHLQQLSDQK